jgi:hypothetical protein
LPLFAPHDACYRSVIAIIVKEPIPLSSLTVEASQQKGVLGGWAAFLCGSALVVLLGMALRFWDLSSAPLWIDESFTVLAGRLALKDILLNQIDFHPPLLYVIQHLWTELFPALSFARVPAAVAGTLTVVVQIASTADLLSRRAALWAGLLIAVSTGHIYYSQDARMYSFLVLGLAFASWGLIGSISPNRSRPWVYSGLYIFGALIAVYAHFVGSVYLLAINLACVVVFVWDDFQPSRFWRWFVQNLVVALASIPWLLQVILTGRTFPGLGISNLDGIVLAFVVRNAVGYAALPRVFDVPVMVLLFGLAVGGVWATWREKRHFFAFVGLGGLVLYPAIILGLNLKTSIMATRVFLPAVLPVTTLAGAMLSMLAIPRLGWCIASFLAIAGLSASASEHFHRTKHDDPRATLVAAAQQGYADAPILTCHFYDAIAVYVAAEELMRNVRILTFQGNDVLRFDERSFGFVNMSMAKAFKSSASDLDTYLGGGYLYVGGLAEALRGEAKVAFVSGECGNHVERFTAQLNALGYATRYHRLFRREGRVVMESGASELVLFER